MKKICKQKKNKNVSKNSPAPSFIFRIDTYRHIDDYGIGTDRRALVIKCQENGKIKFTLRCVDDVWKCEVENLPTGEVISKITVESPEELKKELVRFNFSTEDNVEERYQSIMEYISENEAKLNLVTGRKGVKKSLYHMAELVNKKLHIISDQENNLYSYGGGRYRIDRNCDDIHNLYIDTALENYTHGAFSGIVAQIKTIQRTNDEEFNPDRNIVNFPNGLLNLKTGLLSAHTTSLFSTIQLPYPYIPGGRSEKIDAILTDILQPGDILKLKEYCGYSMTLKVNFKRAMILVGPQNSGKNTVQDIINECVGNDNIESFKLQDLSNRFNLYSLKNKLLNSADELPTKKLTDNSTFKNLTGGSGWFEPEGKNKQAARFRYFIKLLFSANQVPESAVDDDSAYYIRWSIINFLRHFDTNDKNTRTDILDSLTDDDYANFGSECIELFMEVLEKDKFTGDVEEDQKILEYRLKSNHIKEFLKIFEPDEGRYITKTEMYNDVYVPWCEHVGIHNAALPHDEFWKQFKKYSEWTEGRKSFSGKQVRIIKEIKVREDCNCIVNLCP